ncbi:MG2 domain-containing protein [Flavobacterium sp. NRK F10]|uniref:alpha-2-macroglobulin family protein n=1 Tax=Flavobacterium sp. NRK F10 TaxID=2954931 RepID=UPI0020905D44|nr:MG2 domain-containing protein [Flavobacterium sp. NRK F10]MCO6174307.1 MG2 domain-containing protein [Flavobacterium sp. NRK F10]
MKYIYTLSFLFFSTLLIAQNFNKEWEKVYQLEIDGKITSAQKEVQKIYRKASRKKDEKEVIKCIFYQSKFEMITNEAAQEEIVSNLKKELKKSSPVSQAVLHYILATILKEYKQANHYKIEERSKIELNHSKDFLLWNSEDFENEINSNFEAIFNHKEELYKASLSDWKAIFDIPSTIDGKEHNLYDFFHEKYLEHLKSDINLWEFKTSSFQANLKELSLIQPEKFITSNLDSISNFGLKKVLQCIQDYEAFYLSRNNDKLDNSYYSRINYFAIINQSETKFPKELLVLKESTKNIILKQQIRLDQAENLIYIGSQKREVQYQKTALKILDSILSTRVHPNILAKAERTKHLIIDKTLKIELQKTIYPNQSNRALVWFKNVDSVKVSYYRFPLSFNKDFDTYEYLLSPINDSIIVNYVENHKPVNSFTRQLPNPFDYFEHSTEIILEKLEAGNYLIFFEVQNDSITKNKAFAYSQITVTDFYIVEDEDQENDNIYVLNRKTGKPIENVLLINDDQRSKTNSNGKGHFQKQQYIRDQSYNNKILITKDSDSIFHNYKRSFIYIYDNEDIIFEAKAQIFTDRAIYRPGQKIYFKGVLVQNMNFKKSVVPYVTVKVYIEDSKGKELQTYELQTNEFGSFTGEFEIPKNVLTGEFEIYVDEPDNYEKDSKYYDPKEDEHLFWDNVDFDDWRSSVQFKVEEYKRPTFEVTFDKIKENYTIGDTLKIKGNAKALAGNNLSHAKVKYSISKRISALDRYFPYERNHIVAETETDEKGDFSIIFPAIQDDISKDSIISFSYAINADITDTNGETRSASQSVEVSKYMLDLKINTDNILYKEKRLTASIKATTQNDYPVPTKVKAEIYKIEAKSFRKQRTFQIPEIQTLSREDFEQLFPYEPYDKSDYDSTPVLIKTIDLNTAVTTTLDLSFLKELENGKYKVLTKAKDTKGNEIKSERSFTLDSKTKPSLNEKLFSYTDISKPNSDFIEIELFSEIPDLWITTRFFKGQSTSFNTQTDQLINGKKIIRFKKGQTTTLGYHFQFSSIWENLTHEETLRIDPIKTERSLNIEIESFRNKIEPGSNENWSFKILDSKSEAEVLASMYDGSLDQFTTTDWEKIFFTNNGFYLSFPYFYTNQDKEIIRFKNFISYNRKFIYEDLNPLDLKWFGFDFNTRKLNTIKYQKELQRFSEIPRGSKIVSGVVSDELGPIAGANVIVKGTTIGTTTDFDGNYSIIAKPGEYLEVSYVGMKEEIVIENKDSYNIILKSMHLEAVEVVGALGIKRKADEITSSYQIIKSEEITQAGNINAVQALIGKISGLQINTASNDKNSTRIVINGNRSITGNNEALIVIDGKITTANELQNMSTENINEIQVLKGAQGSVLYGELGSNGVIIVTTKDALQNLTQVKTRTNFNETAFFYPQLKTDKNGKISFNFTTPESLTQWKLRLFAHNKNYDTGYFESSIISQKDIMIQTNMPRFVRETDTISVSAKVVNLTNETKSGVAMLMLFDVENNNPIDSIAFNANKIRNFNCKPKESVPVNWIITIPKNSSGLQYKIVAKSGNFSDGEENIIPVVSNRILLTESRPIWIKSKSKKELVFDNLLNGSSTTLQNQKITLEYSSNPIWFVLQSLPYLIEYEHECAEQTFARYYANFIAHKIISGNEKIAQVFETWKNQKVTSKLNWNEELKSIILNETPWLLDTESEEEQNKRLATLMDLTTLAESLDRTFQKLEDKQKSNGAFSWFDGGKENVFITQHILSGLGHLSKMYPEEKNRFSVIATKAISFLDKKTIEKHTKGKKISAIHLNFHFWYARSFFLEEHPLSVKSQEIFNEQFETFKKDWLEYSLYEKGLIALSLQRMGKKEWAKKIITHLKETVSKDNEKGMYWIENNYGYYWYQSPIETQALLIEAFAEIDRDEKTVEELKAWLLSKKQSNHWATTKSTSEAIYALLNYGKNWSAAKDNVKFSIGDSKIASKKLSESEKQKETGYIKLHWIKEEITPDMGKITVDNRSDVPGFGGVYWQYFENLENVTSDNTSALSLSKKLYKKTKTPEGDQLIEINEENLNVGDLITVRLIIKCKENLEFVHLKDSRASCFEPVDVLSDYEYKDGLYFYRSTRDTATHFFFDEIEKGTYVLEYDVRINNKGTFTDGIATLQSMYAPEFSSHSKSCIIKTH